MAQTTSRALSASVMTLRHGRSRGTGRWSAVTHRSAIARRKAGVTAHSTQGDPGVSGSANGGWSVVLAPTPHFARQRPPHQSRRIESTAGIRLVDARHHTE